MGDLFVREAALLRFQQRRGEDSRMSPLSVNPALKHDYSILSRFSKVILIVHRMHLPLLFIPTFVPGRQVHTREIRPQPAGGMSTRY